MSAQKQAKKISISLRASLARFVEDYRRTRSLGSRSRVFEEAVKLLRTSDLEAAYRESAREYDKEWDTAVGDGLSEWDSENDDKAYGDL